MQCDRFGELAHFEGEARGIPFQAQFEDTISTRLPDGTIEQRVVRGLICRDSSGRRRRETYLELGPEMLVWIAYIYDPVANATYVLDMIGKTVSKKEVVPYNSTEPTYEMQDAESKKSNPKAKVEHQHTNTMMREIEGLSCYGVREELGGEGFVEFWFSSELKEVLVEKRVMEGKEKLFRIFDIRRVEPEKTLFNIPTEYLEISERNSNEIK